MFVGTEFDSSLVPLNSGFNTMIGNFLQKKSQDNGQFNTLVGSFNFIDSLRNANTILGAGAAVLSDMENSIVIGVHPLLRLTGNSNVFIGNKSVNPLNELKVVSGDENVVIGHGAGANIKGGDGNIFIGNEAGPTTYFQQKSNQLYIDNESDDEPLIYGDFHNNEVRINGDLSIRNTLEIERDLHIQDDLFVTDLFHAMGKVGIGTAAPDLKLHVDGGTDVKATGGGFAQFGRTVSTDIAIDNDEIMARNNGASSRLSINRSGGDIEILGISPNLGNVGIGLTSPEAKLHVTGPSDANASGGGIIVSGTTTGTNIAIDRNEIMARNNGVTSALYLNFEGSPVHVGESIGIDIGTDVPTADLDVKGSARFRNIPALSSTMDVRIDNSGFLTTSSSDRRLKKNIVTISSSLEKVTRLRGVSFNWQDDDEMQLKHGLIAQEVQEVVPELVFENDGFLGINYSEMAGLFVEAIKDLKAENDQLKFQYKEVLAQLKEIQVALKMQSSITSNKAP